MAYIDKITAINSSNNTSEVFDVKDTTSGYVTTDTKNTAGSTNTTSKIFLVGATSQAANPQTYSNSKLYYTRSSGLYSEGGNDDNFSIISQSGRKIDLSVSTDNTSHTPKVTVDETGVYIGDTTVSSSTITLNSGLWWSDSDNYVRIKNLIAPTNNTDAATKKYVDDSIPTNISSFTNDAGYITSADVPEGASAYTGTISAVSTTASNGTSNGFARGDHTHNITKTTIDTTLGTGSGTTKFYREDGSWATPAYTTNTDTKVSTAAVTSGTTYYPTVGSDTTSAATKYYDKTGISYAGTNGTANGTNGNALLTLGNNTASTTANWKKGTVRLYGTTAYYTDLVSGAPSANRTITFPNATGTVALTSDIPTVPDVSGKIDTAGTGLSKSGTTLNHSNSVTAQTTQAVYPIKIDAQGHISAYGSAVTIPSTITNSYANDAVDGKIMLNTSSSTTSTVDSTKTSGALTFSSSGVLQVGKAHSSEGSQGSISLSNSGGSNLNYTSIVPSGTEARTITLPNKTGTVALTSDIPTIPDVSGKIDTAGTGLSKSGTTLNHSNSVTAQSTQAVYPIKIDAQGHISAYGSAVTIPDVSGKIDTAGTGLSKSGTTLNHSNSVTAQTTQAVYPIKIDAQGHISAYGSAVTIPSDVNVTSTAVTAATTNYIVGSTTSTTTTGTLSKHASAVMYTTADSGTSGYTQLRLGNTTATSSAGGKEGQIRLYGTNATYYLDLKPGAIASSNKTITFPNASGTVALTSDIPTVPTITLNGSSTTSPSFYAPTGAGTSGQYLKSSGSGAPTWTNFPTIPSVTLNGSSSTSPSFYAPTGAGTSGQYLKSNGSGAPTWTNFPTIPSITLNGSASTSPSFYAPTGVGTSGNILKSSGTGAPTWSSLSSSDVTTALGYTPYNNTNPSGYVTTDENVKQTASVNETSTYDIIFSSSDVSNTSTTTEGARKSLNLAFKPSGDGETAKTGRLILNQNAVGIGYNNFYNVDGTLTGGNGIAIGAMNSSQYEVVSTSSQGNVRVRGWHAAKNNDGTVESTNYIQNETVMTTAHMYVRSYSDTNTLTSESNIYSGGITLNTNGTSASLTAPGIDKINNFADPYHVAITGSAVSLNNTNFNVMQSFTITDAGTYLVSVMGMFPALASSAIKIVRLTSNTSTDALTAACEATLPSTVTGNLNKVCFTAILNFTANTTYRIQMKTTSATNGSGYSAYSYVRLL